MKPFFNLWSKTNPEAVKILSPDLGFREWKEVSLGDKEKIWAYFFTKDWFTQSYLVHNTVRILNERYKRKSFGDALLRHGGPHYSEQGYSFQRVLGNCCIKVGASDFYRIFMNENENVVYEMISIFVYLTIDNEAIENIPEGEGDGSVAAIVNHAYETTDRFANDLNDIFEQFEINLLLTRNGFVFRQDKKDIGRDLSSCPVLSFWPKMGARKSRPFRRV